MHELSSNKNDNSLKGGVGQEDYYLQKISSICILSLLECKLSFNIWKECKLWMN